MELIAMRCTREQYESVKDKVGELEWKHCDDFIEYEYICNLEEGGILMSGASDFNHRKIYEQFDKEILFKALDIEVVEKFKISKETVLKYDMRKEFPECFEVKLEVGKVYKSGNEGFENVLIKVVSIQGYKFTGYGFDCSGDFIADGDCFFNLPIEATDQEWRNALVSEAKKRGFEESWIIKGIQGVSRTHLKGFVSYYTLDSLWYNGVCIFSHGIWDEIVPNEINQNGLTYILKK
jgi:hypothetical protein